MRLKVLIVDEGFSSQDEESLQSVMQALCRDQENFERIIIVLHLADY